MNDPKTPAPNAPARGDYVTAKLTPQGHYSVGVVASEPYSVPHFAARRLVRARTNTVVDFGDVPKGQWVSVRFFDIGYYEVPVAWVKPTKKPEAPKPDTETKAPPKKTKKPRVKRKD